MKIRVTTEDIAKGVKGDQWQCAIALAVKRVADASYIEVLNHNVWLQNRDPNGYARNVRYPLPEVAVKFIERFDAELVVEPFEFEL